MKASSHDRRQRFGFTLVELLVAITILSIMLFSLAQAMGLVSQLWISGAGALDNFGKARDIMTVMDRDIQQMVLRPDTAAFVDQNGNPACAFYTNAQSSGTDTRAVSLIQYQLNPTGQTGAIGRLTYGMNFQTLPATITPIVSTPAPTALTQLVPGNLTTETLATGIIQFQYQFVDGNGTIQTPPYTPYGGSGTTPFTYDFVNLRDLANPRAVIVSVVVLSNTAYQLAINNPVIMTKLQTDFPGTPPAANTTYSEVWNAKLNPATGTFDSTLPVPVRAGLRVFQRYIPLPVVSPES